MQISEHNRAHRARQAWARGALVRGCSRPVRAIEVPAGPIVYDEIDGVPSRATETIMVPVTVRCASRDSDRADGLFSLSGRQRRKARKADRRAAKVTT